MEWLLACIVVLAAFTVGYFIQQTIYSADFPTLQESDRREVFFHPAAGNLAAVDMAVCSLSLATLAYQYARCRQRKSTWKPRSSDPL